ncbi:MAG: ATP-dependent Clp protease ATP-binding subunit [Hyphomicrobiaceae bacterium]|nr:ATP-dependent Clp protease ATP-binding subunit [Hyphomicrobiaceae bacterium]
MEHLIAVVLGLALGLWLATRAGWKIAWPPAWRFKVGAPTRSPPSAEASSPSDAAAASLSARLHGLEAVYAPLASNLAHPRELEDQPQFREAVRLLQDPEVPVDIVMQYALGANWPLACAALAALNCRADRSERSGEVVAHFEKFYPWPIHFALEYLLTVEPRPPVGDPVAGAKEWWGDNLIVPGLFRDYFARRQSLGDAPLFGPALSATYASSPDQIRAFLQRVNHGFATALMRQLDNVRRASVDRAFLASFGRFWADRKDKELLIEPAGWAEVLAAAEAAALQMPARSLLVSGEHRVGKTTLLRLLAERLEAEGWTVFEAGAADLMAGQQWFGQLEGRIQRTVEELAASKKLIWYIPDMLQMARSGTHQGQAASVLDQILPAVVSGRLIVWSEATPTSTARLLQLRPTLRGLLEAVRIEPQSQQETSELAQAWVNRLCEEADLKLDADCVPVALSSARQYLSAANFPGSVLDLIKLTVNRALKASTEELGSHEIVVTLSQLTGLPVSILDNKERVDLASIRDYFAARVIGQDEAVGAIVERIAMLKAGLNDPGKPIGVFLFAGSTGTGKTELAKTVAEYLFGSIDRMIRLDMSEFQTAETTHKILGGEENDSLINRVRKQPFSVVLLDEFEKAHAAIWDLFLQVFDDGRLTDTVGNVADFRHGIIVLTTNLGATSHRSSALGFAPTADIFTDNQIMRAIGQTFRPEFQNRLDKVIVFRPLTRDLMRQILKKELNRVLERRGLKYREWAVEWEASAQDFLLEKGFSPEMGARPLKRAIDQYLIAPLAATIVERRFPEGDQFVFIRSDGRAIQVDFVDPDGAAGDPPGPIEGAAQRAPTLPAMVLGAEGTEAEVQALESQSVGIARALSSESWEGLKDRLSATMAAADFWTRADRYETLARLALMDRVKAAAATAEGLRIRLARSTDRAGKHSRELVARLALQLHLVKEGMRDVMETAPIEVVLVVEPAFERTGDGEVTRRWCGELHGMYRAWAGNRHMQQAEVAGGGPRDLPWLLISGFGAHRLLMQEVGLHILELMEQGKSATRAAARVRLAVAPLGDLPADKLRLALADALASGQQPHAVVRRYRRQPSPLVRNMNASWRTGKLDAVLRGDFDLMAAIQR